MSEGKTIYSGSTQTLPRYFSDLGFPLPLNINPSEYYIDLLSVNYASQIEELESRERIDTMAKAYENYLSQNNSPQMKNNKQIISFIDNKNTQQQETNSRISLAKRIKFEAGKFKTLFVRALRSVLRDKSLNIARLMSSLFSSLLFGAIYFKMGMGISTIPDRLGLLQVFC